MVSVVGSMERPLQPIAMHDAIEDLPWRHFATHGISAEKNAEKNAKGMARCLMRFGRRRESRDSLGGADHGPIT